jgi:hypothetical protein
MNNSLTVNHQFAAFADSTADLIHILKTMGKRPDEAIALRLHDRLSEALDQLKSTLGMPTVKCLDEDEYNMIHKTALSMSGYLSLISHLDPDSDVELSNGELYAMLEDNSERLNNAFFGIGRRRPDAPKLARLSADDVFQVPADSERLTPATNEEADHA